jgi:hypothetical protein
MHAKECSRDASSTIWTHLSYSIYLILAKVIGHTYDSHSGGNMTDEPYMLTEVMSKFTHHLSGMLRYYIRRYVEASS